jgi:hypothetical protein
MNTCTTLNMIREHSPCASEDEAVEMLRKEMHP